VTWFRENRFLGIFAIAFGVGLVVCLVLLFVAKSSFNDASARFSQEANERARLQRLDPFPNETNVRKMKTHLENYASSLDRLKADLKLRVPAPPPLAPDQFQTRLREAVTAVTEHAKTNKVKLPENFYLGFDEFSSSLPTAELAPVLGQQLSQIEIVVNIIVDALANARNDPQIAITSFKRIASPQVPTAPTTVVKPGAPSPPVTAIVRPAVEFAFMATPSASRKVINQISSTADQFFIMRTLHVRNEKDKGPARALTSDAAAVSAGSPSPAAKPAASPAIQFIVGNEHIETSARVELVRFTF